ncbi:hypothetical protein AVEN_180566-1 [Araneus ventricosus]|uniref:Uncharacterized protein n=1 Tax=Araneus ventricosus TaxID=182803 RepID=A0A4Y2S873_ARAVE|nr:hypothetical protein AVEN_180566-1 [Araneus ventricosus]
MEVDNALPWNILCANEAHFHLQGFVNTQNCRIWANANSFQMQPLPLHSQKVTVWCGFTAVFIVGPFILEDVGSLVPVTCTVNGTHYDFFCETSSFLHCNSANVWTIVTQNGAYPHIATPVKHLHFGNDRIISRRFPTAWQPRSPYLNPCNFWLRGYLKDPVYGGPIANLAKLKNHITQRIYNTITETLLSVVEHLFCALSS